MHFSAQHTPLLLLLLILTACQNGSREMEMADYSYATLITREHHSLLGMDYQRIAVDASVYSGLMQMLGVDGKCLDFSSQMKPDIERLAASRADLLMLSAYEGAEIKKYNQLGIPIVRCTDFLEPSPLGRAEWMRYFGRLWGAGEKADSLFRIVEANLQGNASDTGQTGIIFDLPYGSAWYQPSRHSTIGQLVEMAGGVVYGDSLQEGGSTAYSAEQMLLKAKDAGLWLIRVYGKDNITLESLAQQNPIYREFRAFKEGNIYVCPTDTTHFFEETPFRPDMLLNELQEIIGGKDHLRYFHRIEKQ